MVNCKSRARKRRRTAKRVINPRLNMGIATRMTRASEFTREQIMRAAERLFAESGYDGTSIRAIVAKAKVNQAAVNYHFEGRPRRPRRLSARARKARRLPDLASS